MDAFAVSVSFGFSGKDLKMFHIMRASFFFGAFQFFMPTAGWYLGTSFVSYIHPFEHWTAFGLLVFIGGKMLFEAFHHNDSLLKKNDIRQLPCLFSLAVATSIDALAVGVSFSVLQRGIWGPAAIIGLITFGVCIFGFEASRRISRLLSGLAGLAENMVEKWAEILGGVVLIGIGVKTLLESLGSH